MGNTHTIDTTLTGKFGQISLVLLRMQTGDGWRADFNDASGCRVEFNIYRSDSPVSGTEYHVQKIVNSRFIGGFKTQDWYGSHADPQDAANQAANIAVEYAVSYGPLTRADGHTPMMKFEMGT